MEHYSARTKIVMVAEWAYFRRRVVQATTPTKSDAEWIAARTRAIEV
jgi:hypothetical protein